MNSAIHRVAALAACLALGTIVASGTVLAQDRDRTQQQDRDTTQIYGSQLMTPQERQEYQNRMRSLGTAEERERYRLEHHERMQERATARGVQLPGTPPAQGGRAASNGPGPAGGGMGAGAGGGGGRR